MRVWVTLLVRRPGITVVQLQRVVRHVLRRQRCAVGTEVGVALVSDAAIRRLNWRFLGIDRPTDVMSFPLDTTRTQRGLASRPRARGPSVTTARSRRRYLGDVVISVDRARVQARAAGHPLRSEIAVLAVHGVLHLLGYDDARRADASRMARRQRTLAAEAGFEVVG